MLHRLGGLFRRGAREAEMQAELQAHLDGLAERNLAAGLSPEEARHAALRAFGGVAQIAERARDERRSLWVEQVWQDLRYAVRSLAKSPSFTITAVLTLALGIGVNAALFSVFNMLLRPLPLPEPDRLVKLSGSDAKGREHRGFSHAEYVAYREGSRALSGILAIHNETWLVEPREGQNRAEPELSFDVAGSGAVAISMVSENHFALLGGRLRLGRTFSAEENATGASVAVLCHRFWEEHFDSAPNVLGATLVMNRQTFTVIGVAAEEFTGAGQSAPAAWVPLAWWSRRPADYGPGGPPALTLVGRLAPGVSEAQAKAELDGIAARRAVEFPGESAKTAVRLQAGLRFVNIPATPQSFVRLSPLFLGFGMVLAIACTNVANLLLARGLARQAEIGVRLTVGASRGRIVRQLLTENVLLCLFGAVIGLVLGTWTLRMLQQVVLAPFLPASLLFFLRPTLDFRVLSFTAALTVGATLIAGLLPAMHTARASLFAMTRNDGPGFVPRFRPSRLRRFLVVGQVALCVTLLSCAGVMVRNLFTLQKPEVGPHAKVVFQVNVKPNEAIADRPAAFREAFKTVRATPGVVALAVNKWGVRSRVRSDATAEARTENGIPTTFLTVEAFDMFGIRVLGGRAFREPEQDSASRVAIISESLAQRLWPGQDAVGKTVPIGEGAWRSRDDPVPEDAFRECEVIGVVRDAVLRPRGDDQRRLYLPFALNGAVQAPLFVQARHNSGAAVREITRAVESQGVGVEFYPSLAFQADQELGPYRGLAALSAALGVLALAMAVVGLYGLMAFTVSQRTREIGIRLALGATARMVISHLMRQGMRVIVIGLASGLAGGGLFAALLGKILYGFIDAFDPLDLVVVTVFFGTIALFACWLPARRATKVDPMVALRAE